MAQERREEQQQRAREAESAAEFAKLKWKYHAVNYRDDSPISPLFPILQTIDQHGTLSKDDLAWLENERVAGPLACYYEQQYEETGESHVLAQACRNWRHCGRPERVIELTMNLGTVQNRRSRAVLFTTRGGAFRDLDNLEDAEHCANQAISLWQQNSYPYRLRGAVFFQRGRAQEGYDDFSEADRLDEEAGRQSSGETRKDMKRALDKANPLDRKRVAEFLIQKDAMEYKWARFYLDHS